MDDDNKRSENLLAQITRADALHLVRSPPLIKESEWSRESAGHAHRFAASLDACLTTRTWLGGNDVPLRVGRYAESLLRDLSTQAEAEFPVLAQNLQIFEHRATIGELDLVVGTPTTPLHLELAVKLYLGLPDRSHSLDGWVGPNPRDTLGKKFRHLKFKQLPLSNTPQAREALGLSPEETIYRYPWIKGYLFHFQNQELPLPTAVASNHQRGWWTLDTAPWCPHPNDDVQYCIPPKPYWIRHYPSDIAVFQNWQELQRAATSHIEQRLTCHVIAINRGTQKIASRGFIASSTWQEAAYSLSDQLVSENGNHTTSESNPRSGSK